MEWIFWLVLFAIAVAFQLNAVYHQRHWGMLTSSVRWLSVRVWGRIILFPLWAWLTVHWFLGPFLPGETGLWYVLAIAGGVFAALLVDYKDVKDTHPDLDSTG